jgi:hypothetical protein
VVTHPAAVDMATIGFAYAISAQDPPTVTIAAAIMNEANENETGTNGVGNKGTNGVRLDFSIQRALPVTTPSMKFPSSRRDVRVKLIMAVLLS